MWEHIVTYIFRSWYIYFWVRLHRISLRRRHCNAVTYEETVYQSVEIIQGLTQTWCRKCLTITLFSMLVCVSAKWFILCITLSLQNNIKQDRKCVYEYNAIFEARSDISCAQLMNGMTVASLPWQHQCTLISGVEIERDTLKCLIQFIT
jgi:hypothetical protein